MSLERNSLVPSPVTLVLLPGSSTTPAIRNGYVYEIQSPDILQRWPPIQPHPPPNKTLSPTTPSTYI